MNSIFELKSNFNTMLLLDTFHQMEIKTIETVAPYISKFENLAHQIKDCSESINDAIIIAKILGTLPPKFRIFRWAWLSVDDILIITVKMNLLALEYVLQKAYVTRSLKLSVHPKLTFLRWFESVAWKNRSFTFESCVWTK